LEALVNEDQESRNKAFLTRFFGLLVQEIKPQTGEIEVLDKDRFGKGYQEALIEIENWRKLVGKGSWGILFSTIEKAWQYMPSASEVEHATVRSDRSALRQLVSYALKRILGKGESFEIFTRRIRSLNMGVIKEGEEEDQFYKETSLPAVTVMTLHGSKGLEFPYVFLPTGGGQLWSAHDSLYTAISQGEGREYHLDKSEVKRDAEKADLQEWARLFYVACTRAAKWMAIPIWSAAKNTAASEFLDESILGAIQEKPELFEEFSINESNWREITIPQTAEALPASSEDSSSSITQIEQADFESTEIPKKRQKVGASFTKISETGSVKVKQDVIQQELEADLPAGVYENDEGEDLSTQVIEIPEDSLWANLPRGKYAGNLIHEILERTDFRIFHSTIYEDESYSSQLDSWRKEVLIPQCIKQKVGAYGPKEDREHLYNNVEKIICNLLQNPIQFPGLSFDGLSLTELAPSKPMNHSLQSNQDFEKGTYIAEPDFWYPFGTTEWKFDPNASNNPGWFTGSVDLFFEIDNEYYVLDWKTNSLEDYNSSSLDKAMVKKKYIWQAALYGEAMQRWLKSLGSEYKVKGALYYFVRGVEIPNSQSMWYKSIENLADYDKEITEQKAHVIHKFLGKSTDAKTSPSEEEQV
jgi:exodeoxyribonuclease V beta subunit